ncbi:MAG: peptide chain release factor-like protein [Kiritimatiellaeota bacterium]|nr:peptide chain release factor-like protein [Kiritimatiellota bacterium]
MDILLSTDKQAKLAARMTALGINEADIAEKFVQGSGPGGQKINKTSSCVFISHAPSGIEVKCQRTRSLTLNRYHARWELCERLPGRIQGERSARQQEAEKIRRQKRRRSRRQKAKMLDDKRRHGEKKSLRARVGE